MNEQLSQTLSSLSQMATVFPENLSNLVQSAAEVQAEANELVSNIEEKQNQLHKLSNRFKLPSANCAKKFLTNKVK